jgi:Co/Zn/Cd efflux system component
MKGVRGNDNVCLSNLYEFLFSGSDVIFDIHISFTILQKGNAHHKTSINVLSQSQPENSNLTSHTPT